MIKPKQTHYNNYHFRSRLEARWATFFDSLHIRYQYELQGYDIQGLGGYLPDFYLPDLGSFVEIKGEAPTQLEKEKAFRLCLGAERNTWIFVGDPVDAAYHHWSYTNWSDAGLSPADTLRLPFFSDVVHHIDNNRLVLSFEGKPAQWDYIDGIGYFPNMGADLSKKQAEMLRRAQAHARRARFEYGETPIPIVLSS